MQRPVGEILGVRKHLGLMPPAPVQAAMIAALGDDAHVQEQRERYRARRCTARAGAASGRGSASTTARPGSTSGRRTGEPAWETVAELADLGILVAPGAFYGDDPAIHVRIALTATDAAIANAVARLELL